VRNWLGIIGLLTAVVFTACENFSFSPTLPISSSIQGEIKIDSSGVFTYEDSGDFFGGQDLEDVLGNIKSLSLDSVFLVIDSTSVLENDSLPYLEANAVASLDTISIQQDIRGTLMFLKKLPSGIKIDASPDELIQISILLKDKANDNQNTPWNFQISGLVDGAPVTIYFKVKFYGEIETKPAELI
tara:strand:+ start:9784 stop:10341 length:558 start_codon:yes stop_codon:yes gene_type:complete